MWKYAFDQGIQLDDVLTKKIKTPKGLLVFDQHLIVEQRMCKTKQELEEMETFLQKLRGKLPEWAKQKTSLELGSYITPTGVFHEKDVLIQIASYNPFNNVVYGVEMQKKTDNPSRFVFFELENLVSQISRDEKYFVLNQEAVPYYIDYTGLEIVTYH